jgi:hypothetical protein
MGDAVFAGGLRLSASRSHLKGLIMVQITKCLADLGITDASTFENCDNTDDELKVIKRNWTKLVLIQHPVSKQIIYWHHRIVLCCHNFIFSNEQIFFE